MYSVFMGTKAVLFAAWICAVSATGCCKACSAVSGIAKELGGPDAVDGEPLVKAYVENDEELRKRICGVDTQRLENLVVKQNAEGNYSIQGTPIEKPLAKPPSAKPDAGPSGKPLVDGKQILCRGNHDAGKRILPTSAGRLGLTFIGIDVHWD